MGERESLARQWALRALARREHCRRELEAKLAARGFEREEIDRALDALEAEGLLSDFRFAESFLRARLRRGEALWLAVRKARARGVRNEALERVARLLEAEDDASSRIRELIRRRDPEGRRFDDERVRARLARFLRNKGFDAATILRALDDRSDEGSDQA